MNSIPSLPSDDSVVCEDKAGSGSRTMLLPLFTEQPGHFCCDNGFCVDSRLRCDFKQHCLDNSDEKNCELISVKTDYTNSRPPQPGPRLYCTVL